jgi:hypothetical protein
MLEEHGTQQCRRRRFHAAGLGQVVVARGQCCGDNRSYRTQTMKENKSSRTKTKTQDKGQLKGSFLNSRFLKRRSPLQVPIRLLL